MSTRQWLPIVLAGCGLLGSTMAQAQAGGDLSCPKTREEVRQECIDFLKTHRWSELEGNYVLKSGAKLPEGVKTREEVRAERDKFLSTHRWNAISARWVPLSAPREISKLSRAEVRAETQAFMKTHRWDEASSSYVESATKTQ